mmetsp:Transcript_25594/g.36064  ORF Transcript_25594/g.36064 Transcript_25594/m.36064 type:complete len:1059 (-) Transcript_25594:73-3249(-)
MLSRNDCIRGDDRSHRFSPPLSIVSRDLGSPGPERSLGHINTEYAESNQHSQINMYERASSDISNQRAIHTNPRCIAFSYSDVEEERIIDPLMEKHATGEEHWESCLYREPPASLPPASIADSPRMIMGNSPPSFNDRSNREMEEQYAMRTSSFPSYATRDGSSNPKPHSNLTALLNQQNSGNDFHYVPTMQQDGPQKSVLHAKQVVNEADSASEPVHSNMRQHIPSGGRLEQPVLIPPMVLQPEGALSSSVPLSTDSRRSSWSGHRIVHNQYPSQHSSNRDSSEADEENNVRRCSSSGALSFTPLSSSPHVYLKYQREKLEATMQQRLMALRERDTSPESSHVPQKDHVDDSNKPIPSRLTNHSRKCRRAEHAKAVLHDLCEIVTDLFVAESKLLNPSKYGVQSSLQRANVSRTILQFLTSLPPRYALGIDTPSEVLLHMRLMAVARSSNTKAVVHIANLEDSASHEKTHAPTHTRPQTVTRLVTIASADARGLLEYITNLLSTGGSRVIDADVMLTKDNIVLDRFVVEMNGRLRLDKLANCIESFLKSERESETSSNNSPSSLEFEVGSRKSMTNSPKTQPPGPLYIHPSEVPKMDSPAEISEEIRSAVPLKQVLNSTGDMVSLVPMRGKAPFPKLIRHASMPVQRTAAPAQENYGPMSSSLTNSNSETGGQSSNSNKDDKSSMRASRPLVNREAFEFPRVVDVDIGATEKFKQREIPLIPFEELMLIETLGMGRVSTIYRAAWQQRKKEADEMSQLQNVSMVALKVASVNPRTGDMAHVGELQREADIARVLRHPNICDLKGVAADEECFCLAYEFCEGGSLLSLLSDSTRFYEYLPIALDIANGMAYLHHLDIIHRDLKPSNVLLTRDHRAKIADFGMSVADTGQELTAETGTYRYMAPEVIRHESYSSNADVYSFGIVLWQLITREVPFATMTPIQAAYAVAEGRRPEIPASCPEQLRDIISLCWDQDSQKRPSFTYIVMALADYAKMAFNPANVGALTLQIANQMLVDVQGNSTINVDFSTPFASPNYSARLPENIIYCASGNSGSNVGLEI